jgi:diaminohydroxyphosphoribosylaminopyrimidine deaminase/5-amino-6-(5-phosphoribosylamino)uracil reductase
VDEFIVYLAPSLLGPTARALVELPEISQLEQRLRLAFSECTPVGPDLRLTAVPVAPAVPGAPSVPGTPVTPV